MVKAGLSRRVGLSLGGTRASFFYSFGGNSWGDENRLLWLQVWFCFFLGWNDISYLEAD